MSSGRVFGRPKYQRGKGVRAGLVGERNSCLRGASPGDPAAVPPPYRGASWVGTRPAPVRTMTPRWAAREPRGRRSELLALWWLRLSGWSVLGRRITLGGVEVDLVVRRRRVVALVEVKSHDASSPIDAARLVAP